MNWATAIVLIVLISAVAGVLRSRYRAQAGIVADKQGNERPIERNDPASERELEDLRERVKVLERIATDGNTPDAMETKRIAAEIEALRNTQDK